MPPVRKMKKSAKGRKIGRQRLKMRDWLILKLNEGGVPSLRWRNKAAEIFEISWKHASGRTWVEKDDTEIFKLYALHTGKYREGGDPDPKKWKANFRCALNSLKNDVREVCNESHKKGENACKVYQFIDEAETKIKAENDCKDDICTPTRDSNMESCEEETEETSVAPVIKMEAPSPASEEMSQPPSPTDKTEVDHCYSKNGLANIPNLPSFKNSICLSGGIVECRVPDVIPPTEKICFIQNNTTTNSHDDLNSEGGDMSDEEFVQMVDNYRSDYERTDSDSSESSPINFWKDSLFIDLAYGKPLVPVVVVVDGAESSVNQDWKLASLTELK